MLSWHVIFFLLALRFVKSIAGDLCRQRQRCNETWAEWWEKTPTPSIDVIRFSSVRDFDIPDKSRKWLNYFQGYWSCIFCFNLLSIYFFLTITSCVQVWSSWSSSFWMSEMTCFIFVIPDSIQYASLTGSVTHQQTCLLPDKVIWPTCDPSD